MAKNYAYLVMVNSNMNNNKFYEITENENGSLDVRFGRVGAKGVERHYEPYEHSFFELLEEKKRKGYEDNTIYHAVQEQSSAKQEALSYKPIEDEAVQEFMNLLINSSREFMKANYTVSAVQITPKAIMDAEHDIAELIDIANDNTRNNKLYDFNQKLENDLFHRIERSMKSVKECLAHTEDDFPKIIQREREMIENLKGIIEQEKKLSEHSEKAKDITYLEANGLKIRPVTYKEEDQITAHLGKDYRNESVERRYVRAFAVDNERTRSNYEDYKKQIGSSNIKLFYHGSKVENWNSIMTQGLSLNPNATVTGKMFGQGLYFAPEARKALNYMDTVGSCWNNGQRDTGYTAVFCVNLGEVYEPNRILGSSFRSQDLPHGKNSVFASKHNRNLGLKNDEYIVFNQSACTIKYMLEMKSPFAPELEFNLNRNAIRDNLEQGFGDLIKSSQGLRCELIVEQLPSPALEEVARKITDGHDCNQLFVDYNSKSDTIEFTVVDCSGDTKTISPNLTKDDYKFFSREMKKSYVDSENEWKALVKSSADMPLGKTVISKEDKADTDKQHKKKNIERD